MIRLHVSVGLMLGQLDQVCVPEIGPVLAASVEEWKDHHWKVSRYIEYHYCVSGQIFHILGFLQVKSQPKYFNNIVKQLIKKKKNYRWKLLPNEHG